MRPQYKSAATIFVLVLLGGIVSFLLFVFVGTQEAMISLVAIIPVLLGVSAFVVRRTRHGNDGTKQIRTRRANRIANRFAEVYTAFTAMRESYPDLVSDADLPVEQLVNEMEKRGFNVDRSNGSASLGRLASPNVASLKALEGHIDDFEAELDEAFFDAAQTEVQRIYQHLADLDDVIDVKTARTSEEFSGQSISTDEDSLGWRELGRKLETHREQARNEIERAVETLRQELVGSREIDRQEVEQHLSEAETASTIENRVAAVRAARNALRNEASDSFDELREQLVELVESVRSSGVLDQVESRKREQFESTAVEIEGLTDAAELQTLREHERSLKSICLELIEIVTSNVEHYLDKLNIAEVPDSYFGRPEVLDAGYVDQLERTEEVDAYQRVWMEAATELMDAHADLQEKQRVASVYTDIVPDIDEELQRTGMVTPEDLPVTRKETVFMGLYARTHDVSYDPTEPALSISEGDGEYQLTVNVVVDEDETGFVADVMVTRGDQQWSERVSGVDNDSVTFESVPYGEYSVEIIPKTEKYERTERVIHLPNSRTVNLEVKTVSLRERLCDGFGDVSEYVDELTEEFETAFAENDHVTESMPFPVDEEYVPCLLATWAEQAGYEARETEDGVVVFDSGQLVDELRKATKHNLEEGEDLPFTELRARFLSVPAPDEAIKAAMQMVDGGHATDVGIIKESTGKGRSN